MKKNIFIYRFSTGIICMMILIAISCKKDKDILKPTVYITSPNVDEQFSVFENITVKVTIEDDTKLDKIKIVLENENQIAVLPAITIFPTEKAVSLIEDIELNDIHLESGNYYIRVYAFDGINETTSFRKVYINEFPRERKGVFIISTPNASAVSIYKIDSTFQNISPFFSVTGDYIGSSVSSYYQTLNILGYISGNFNCYNFRNTSLKWSIPTSNNAPFPTFNNIFYAEKNNYISYYNGDIKGYDEVGLVKFNAVSFSGYNSLKLIKLTNNIVSAQKAYTGGDTKLVTYNKTYGGRKHDMQIYFDVVDFCMKQNDDVVVFGNAGSQGIVKIYESGTNTIWEPLSLPPGKVFSAVRIDSDTYLVAHQNGIYKYHFSAGGFLPYLPGVIASKIVYDEINNDIMVVSGATVIFHDYPSSNLKFSFTHSEAIADAHLFFNK